jgi:hypothetical protein
LWFSPGTPVSSNNKTDHHDIAEILLKVALNPITTYYINVTVDGLPLIKAAWSSRHKEVNPGMVLTKFMYLDTPFSNRHVW